MNRDNCKKKLLIHIGRHKSGTTSLQASLWENRDILINEGIYYPNNSRREFAHHLFAESLNPKNVRENGLQNILKSEYVTDLIKEIEETDHQNILLSSEAFQNCNPEHVKEVLKDYDVSIVFYIREQVNYLESAYLQEVQATNYHDSIENFEINRFRADYYEFYHRWVNSFGSQNITVRLFEKTSLYQGDIVHDFFNSFLFVFLKKEFKYKLPNYDGFLRNTSLSGQFIPFKLRLNKMTNNLLPCVYQALGILSYNSSSNLTIISEKLKNEVKNKYKESNDKLLRELNIQNGNFSKVKDKEILENYNQLGPKAFLRILKQLCETDDRCQYLINELYNYNTKINDNYFELSFSKNISLDSLKHLYILKENEKKPLLELTETKNGKLLISKEHLEKNAEISLLFDPQNSVSEDHILLERRG